MEEAEKESLNEYLTFSDFFNRKLKEGIRPINLFSYLVYFFLIIKKFFF
jgi:phosphatidylserine decarboxylase